MGLDVHGHVERCVQARTNCTVEADKEVMLILFPIRPRTPSRCHDRLTHKHTGHWSQRSSRLSDTERHRYIELFCMDAVTPAARGFCADESTGFWGGQHGTSSCVSSPASRREAGPAEVTEINLFGAATPVHRFQAPSRRRRYTSTRFPTVAPAKDLCHKAW